MAPEEMSLSTTASWTLAGLRRSKQTLVFLVYLSLLLDNILLTVVVPIIPDYLYYSDNPQTVASNANELQANTSSLSVNGIHHHKQIAPHGAQYIHTIFDGSHSKQWNNVHREQNDENKVQNRASGGKEQTGSLVLVKSGHLQAMLPGNCSGNRAKFDIYSLIPHVNIVGTKAAEPLQVKSTTDPTKELVILDATPSSATSMKVSGKVVSPEVVDENRRVGVLLSSKALVQLAMNPVVGVLTSRLGYHLPLFFGSVSLLLAALAFAFAEHFASLLLARSLQGVASACIGVSGMCVVADLYPDDAARSKVMGLVLGSIALGVLLGYPFGGFLYDFVGKMAPFLIIAALIFIDGAMQIFCLNLKPIQERTVVVTSWPRLLTDGFVVLTAGAIWVSTSAMAILEPCLPIWLMGTMKPQKWQLGTVFIPDSLGYLLGTNCFGLVAYRLGRWRVAIAAMMLVGLSCVLVPSATGVAQLALPHFGLGLGIGIVDAALVPLLASLVDSRHAAHYGSVYTLQQMAVSLAYALGPLIGGELVHAVGFPWLMRVMGLLNILYCPLLLLLINREASSNKLDNILLANTPMVNYKSSSTADADHLYQRFFNSNDSD